MTDLRSEFLRLLTEDSPHNDRRRRDYNQAIFDPDRGYAIWIRTDLDMVMEKFDRAVKAASAGSAVDEDARQLVPALSDEVDRLRAENEQLRVEVADQIGLVRSVRGELAAANEQKAADRAYWEAEHIDALAEIDELRAENEALREQLVESDEHMPWSYTEYGVLCACGSPMDKDEQCLSALKEQLQRQEASASQPETPRSDLLFDRASGYRLADSPVEGLDEPSITGQSDLLGSSVDPFGQLVGDSEIDVFRHGKHDSTCTSNIRSDSVLS